MKRKAEISPRKEESHQDLDNEKIIENDVLIMYKEDKGSIVFHNNKVAAHFNPPSK